MPRSLLTYLVTYLTHQTENAATEGLVFLAREHDVVAHSLSQLVGELLGVHPGRWLFESQRSDQGSGARPDVLLRCDGADRPSIAIEAKFWAPLTEKQPVKYFSVLAPGGALVFVVPEPRAASIWQELVGRCLAAGLLVREADGMHAAVSRSVEGEPSHGSWTLTLSTWERLNKNLLDAATAADEQVRADVQSWCRMVTELSEPVLVRDGTAGEEAGAHDVIRAALGKIAESGFGSGEGYQWRNRAGSVGRYLTLGGMPNWCLEWNPSLREYAAEHHRNDTSVFWLTQCDAQFPSALERLRDDPCCGVAMTNGGVAVPIVPEAGPAGTEVNSWVRRIVEVAGQVCAQLQGEGRV